MASKLYGRRRRLCEVHIRGARNQSTTDNDILARVIEAASRSLLTHDVRSSRVKSTPNQTKWCSPQNRVVNSLALSRYQHEGKVKDGRSHWTVLETPRSQSTKIAAPSCHRIELAVGLPRCTNFCRYMHRNHVSRKERVSNTDTLRKMAKAIPKKMNLTPADP